MDEQNYYYQNLNINKPWSNTSGILRASPDVNN